jgi:hypothetical protein
MIRLTESVKFCYVAIDRLDFWRKSGSLRAVVGLVNGTRFGRRVKKRCNIEKTGLNQCGISGNIYCSIRVFRSGQARIEQ